MELRKEYPPGWQTLSLSDLGGVVGGKTPSKAQPAFWNSRDIHWASPKDMKGFLLVSTEDMISTSAAAQEGLEILPPGAVLMVTRSGILSHTFPVMISNVSTTINQDIKAVKPNAYLFPKYLAYALKNSGLEILKECAKQGTTVPSVETTALESFRLPLPPLAEQKRIADKLDSLLAKVDRCRERLDRVPAILKRFRQAVLAAATSGRLTEEWRAQTESSSPEEWRQSVLNDICEQNRIITYGVVKLGDQLDGGVKCLRTSDVRWLRIDIANVRTIAPELSEQYSRTILRGGEVLVNVRGTLGGVAVASNQMAGWNVSREIAVIPIDSTIASPKFVAFVVGTESSQNWLSSVQKGVAYTGINIEDLRTLPVKLPPICEQHEMVKRIEKLLAVADQLDAKMARVRKRIDNLTPSLLAKAFRGELVPQDPNEEPASVLLERIKGQKASAEAAPTRQGRKPKTDPNSSPVESDMLDRKTIAPSHLTDILKERGSLTPEALWSASQLEIDAFYEQLKDEELRGLLKEVRKAEKDAAVLLEALG